MPLFLKRRGKKVFFSHIPKTGGTYIEDLFTRNGYEVMFLERRPRRLGLRCSPQHYHAELVNQLIDLDEFEFSLVAVRHPVDRLLSEYRDRTKRKYLRLLSWLEHAEALVSEDPFALDNHLRPQVEFLDDRLVVYRQEAGFDKAWAKKINREFELGFRKFSVPRRRQTVQYHEELASEEVSAVLRFCEKHYSEDFEKLGYDIHDAAAFRGTKEMSN